MFLHPLFGLLRVFATGVATQKSSELEAGGGRDKLHLQCIEPRYRLSQQRDRVVAPTGPRGECCTYDLREGLGIFRPFSLESPRGAGGFTFELRHCEVIGRNR